MIWKQSNSGESEQADILRYTNKTLKTTFIITAVKKPYQYIVYCHQGFIYNSNSHLAFYLNLENDYAILKLNNEEIPSIPLLNDNERYDPSMDKFIVGYSQNADVYTREEFIEYKTKNILKNNGWNRFYTMLTRQNRNYLVAILEECIIGAISNDVRRYIKNVLDTYTLKVGMKITMNAFLE